MNQSGFEISDWKPFTKKTLRGFFSVTLTDELILHNCGLLVKNGARWVGMPSPKYTAKSGEISHSPLVEFTSREEANKFRNAVLEAIDQGRGGQ